MILSIIYYHHSQIKCYKIARLKYKSSTNRRRLTPISNHIFRFNADVEGSVKYAQRSIQEGRTGIFAPGYISTHHFHHYAEISVKTHLKSESSNAGWVQSRVNLWQIHSISFVIYVTMCLPLIRFSFMTEEMDIFIAKSRSDVSNLVYSRFSRQKIEHAGSFPSLAGTPIV